MDTAPSTALASFAVRCGYCGGEHAARIDASTIGVPYGSIYDAYCPVALIRWGVHASFETRIR